MMNAEQPEHEKTQLPPEAPIRDTHVVTCFLLRTDTINSQLLLVQRSSRVGSYHAHWAGISGFVEPEVTPEEQAYTEIREETGLQRNQVRLVRRGAIVEHVDAALRRHFFVHPFLFEVSDPGAIKTDWEAADMRWIDPTTLRSYETVPKLPEAFESALNGEEVR
jgi:8-oxo-dGTP diphosphatase